MYRFLLILLCLCGCNPFRHLAPDSADIQTRQWARRGELTDPYPLYCYQTLAEKMCYTKPILKGGERLVGHYGPAPRPYENASEGGPHPSGAYGRPLHEGGAINLGKAP